MHVSLLVIAVDEVYFEPHSTRKDIRANLISFLLSSVLSCIPVDEDAFDIYSVLRTAISLSRCKIHVQIPDTRANTKYSCVIIAVWYDDGCRENPQELL